MPIILKLYSPIEALLDIHTIVFEYIGYVKG